MAGGAAQGEISRCAGVQGGDKFADFFVDQISHFAKCFDFRAKFLRKSVRSRNPPLVGMGREGKNPRTISFRFGTEKDRMMNDFAAKKLFGRLTSLVADVDTDLIHRPDRADREGAGIQSGTEDAEVEISLGKEERFGHLASRRIVIAEKEDVLIVLHFVSGRMVGCRD